MQQNNSNDNKVKALSKAWLSWARRPFNCALDIMSMMCELHF